MCTKIDLCLNFGKGPTKDFEDHIISVMEDLMHKSDDRLKFQGNVTTLRSEIPRNN